MARGLRGIFIFKLLVLVLGAGTAAFAPSPAVAQDNQAAGQANGAERLLSAGRELLRAGSPEAAAHVFARVIEDERAAPEVMAEAFLYRGIANARIGANTAALSDFGNAIWLDALPPDLRARLHAQRGRVHQALGHAGAAQADFQTALRLAPSDPDIVALAAAGAKGGVAMPDDIATGTLPVPGAGPPGKQVERAPSLKPDGVSTPAASAVYTVQLGALADMRTARNLWDDLLSRHADLLSGLEPSFEPSSVSGRELVRLRVGPVATLSATRSLCDKLRQRGQDCYPVGQ